MSLQPSSSLPGVIPNASPDAYHLQGKNYQRGDARLTMSRGELVKFWECPRKWLRGIPDESSDAMTWGALLDCIVLTPSRFEQAYVVVPETYSDVPEKYVLTDAFEGEWNPRTKVCQEWKAARVAEGFTVLTPAQLTELQTPSPWNWNATVCQSWREEQAASGKLPVKPALASSAWLANKRLHEDEEIEGILTSSQTQVQVNVEWHDKATDIIVPVKCLLDLATDPSGPFGDTLYDLKSTESADAQKWARSVYQWKLHWQAALYMDAMNVASGRKYRQFGFVIQESSPPFEPTNRVLAQEFMDLGRDMYRRALAKYCQCLHTGIWPGYDSGITQPEAWMAME